MTEIPDDELQLLDGAYADLRSLGMEFHSRPGWFPQLLARLLSATLQEYQHLRLGLKHSTAMVTWACRNLLDLHIYTRYALLSEDCARRLVGERLTGGIELFDAFQTWLARNDPALVPLSVAETLHALTETRADSGLADTPPLKLKRVSAEVGLADEWANMDRLSLRLAQPTAFSILAEENEMEGWKSILFRAGAGHGLEIFRLIRESEDAQKPRRVD